MGGFVARPPLTAMYGPTRNARPATTKATALHQRGQLIRVAREAGSKSNVATSATGKSIPSGRVR
jgi:hypothetical protein